MGGLPSHRNPLSLSVARSRPARHSSPKCPIERCSTRNRRVMFHVPPHLLRSLRPISLGTKKLRFITSSSRSPASHTEKASSETISSVHLSFPAVSIFFLILLVRSVDDARNAAPPPPPLQPPLHASQGPRRHLLLPKTSSPTTTTTASPGPEPGPGYQLDIVNEYQGVAAHHQHHCARSRGRRSRRPGARWVCGRGESKACVAGLARPGGGI